MLYDLGGVGFQVAGLNADKLSREREASFATYEVVGGAPVYEFMGEGERSVEISGKCHPYHFGGVGALDALEAIRASGEPVYLMRGDGRPLGWVIIKSITEADAWLQYRGDPAEITHTIKLLRCDAPGVGALGFFFSLF